ncbi:hypothetical protein M3914_003358 [Vibrio metschnikovii]|nr:hypothetical protein [Vibrio metschnikovii]EKO3684942.1 hypothetical protein [Vibrio metschnikovii]EKO3914688.1 hypothetical protein [Vibrio metschnikovii]
MANEEMLRYVEEAKRNNHEYSLAYQELNERQHALQQQIAKQQALLHEQERELNQNRKRLKEQQLIHEKELMLDTRERENFYEEREKELMSRRNQMELRLKEQKDELTQKQIEILEKERMLEAAYIELAQERERYTEENRKQIESKSQEYVTRALSGLEAKENSFHWLSKMWAGLGALSIVLGVVFMIMSTFYGVNSFHNSQDFSWVYFLYVTFRGLIVVAMFIAFARYAFIFSNSYMHESLKNSERRHAINFGKFYLEAYGANASWEQVKEAFQHWNISSDSAFTKRNASDFDPKVMEKVVELSKALSRNSSSKKADPILETKA